MSDVKRYWFPQDEFKTDIPYVESPDYAKLEAEAQALREEVKNRTAECNGLHEMLRQEHDRTEKARDELAALSARVVVLPDRAQHDAGDSEHSDGCVRGFNDCLDELARLNGKAVSEGLLRRVAIHKPGYDADHYAAVEELLALLGEGKEHE